MSFSTGSLSNFPNQLDNLNNTPSKVKVNGIAPVSQIISNDWNVIADCMYNIESYSLVFDANQDVRLQGFAQNSPTDVAITYIITVTGMMPVYTGIHDDSYYSINLHDSFTPDIHTNRYDSFSTNTVASSLSFTGLPGLGQFGLNSDLQTPKIYKGVLVHGNGWMSGYDASGKVTALSVSCEVINTQITNTSQLSGIGFNIGFKALPINSLTTTVDYNYNSQYYDYNLVPTYNNGLLSGRSFTLKIFAILEPNNNTI